MTSQVLCKISPKRPYRPYAGAQLQPSRSNLVVTHMKNKTLAGLKAEFTIALICLILNGLLAINVSAQTPASAPSSSTGLPAGVQDVVALTKAGIGEDPILAKIKKAGTSYDLTAEQIIYLKNLGVSENVITTLIGPASAPVSVPTPVTSAPVVPPAPAPAIPAPVVAPPSAPAASTPVAVPPAPVVTAPIAAPVSAVTSAQPPPPLPNGIPPAPVMGAAPGTTAAAPEVNFNYFHDQLAPYGTWVEVPGYGACWSPDRVIAANPDWRPYYDMGHWEYTENGWFWASDYNWGDIPFHYGRWIRTPQIGWLWVPDYTWGPAWVAWRHAEADGYIGWAPLPYGAVWVDGGWRFHDHAIVDVGFDFGLGEDFFVFVGNDHFRDERFFRLRGRVSPFEVHRERIHEFYGRSLVRNEFRRDEHGRFVNEGLGRERIERVTQRRVEQVHFEERHPFVRPEPAHAVREAGHPEAGHPEAGHPQVGHAPAERPAPAVNKVFRPPAPAKPAPVPAAKPAPTAAAKPAPAPAAKAAPAPTKPATNKQ
jgi:hypothetical protein